MDKEREINEKLRKENIILGVRVDDFLYMYKRLVNMIPFYKRKAAKELIDSIC